MSKVMLNMEELDQVTGGFDWDDFDLDDDDVIDAAKTVKDGIVDGVTWVGRTIWGWFH